MYERFIEANKPKGTGVTENHYAFSSQVNKDIKKLFEECGRKSIKRGLYRIHDANSSIQWSGIIGNYFEQHKGRIIPFGYDWVGRQYAMYVSKNDMILMFDPATAEVSELNQNLISFHNQDLVDDLDSFLSEKHFDTTIGLLGISEVKYGDCIGHKVPLFLSGSDTLDNYEVVDIEVYWEFQCQIYSQIKKLPPGTKINSINFE